VKDEQRQKRIREHIRRDRFSEMLGATVEIVAPGHSRATLTVTEEMLNFHGQTHGGVIFALGDMAFAAAGNSRGQTAVALNVAINFLKATGLGDQLVAEALERSASGPIALYDITVRDARTGELVAKSADLLYRKKEWFVPGSAGSDGKSSGES